MSAVERDPKAAGSDQAVEFSRGVLEVDCPAVSEKIERAIHETVAKRLHRQWVGIEREAKYIRLAQERIEAVEPEAFDADAFEVRSKKKLAPRVAFSVLLENGYLRPGERLYFQKDRERSALVKPDAHLRTADGFEGSIHQAARHYTNGAPCNGWDLWFLKENGEWIAFARKFLQFSEWTLGRQIWLMRNDGVGAFQLTEEANFNHSSIFWSADGERLIFMRLDRTNVSNSPEIWMVDVESGEATQLIVGGYLPMWVD